MLRRQLTWLVSLAILVSVCGLTRADVAVPNLFSDHMVLQRRTTAPIWGTAAPGEHINIVLTGARDAAGGMGGSQMATAKADAQGNWKAKFQPLEAGGPYRITIKGDKSAKPIEIADVLIGEVWVCSGQSNMQWDVQNSMNATEEISKADFPQIRLFQVPIKGSPKPLSDVDAKWKLCSKETIPGFTAVGYFFGRDLHQNLRVPVGIVQTAVGGTPAESWTPREDLVHQPMFKEIVEKLDEMLAAYPKTKADYDKQIAAWEQANGDSENKGEAQGWNKPETADADWSAIKVAQPWQKAGLKGNGVVWFRKEVDIPTSWAGQELSLELGAIDDFDTAYFNGQKVGGIGKDNKLAPLVKRKYKISADLVKAGRAVIAVRIYDSGGDGGLTGPEKEMLLAPAAVQAKPPIALAGDWKYKVEKPIDATTRPKEPIAPGNPWTASALWNAMVNPLVPYGIRGAIWYQGESNADHAMAYRTLFPTMIQGWRRAWNQGDPSTGSGRDFPFFYVQLANFSNWKPPVDHPQDSTWAELREAQTMTLKLPNTGMASAIDIGDSADIHPKNKQEVGRRLALIARSTVYGQDVVYSGPMYDSSAIEGDRIRLKFNHLHGGLTTKENAPLKGFAIAGPDKKFVWADAKINGDTVLVSSPTVKEPAAVRYGWDNDPKLNLYNKAGLPASPFRTDDWPASKP
jgi:sialate O-acetylesterase